MAQLQYSSILISSILLMVLLQKVNARFDYGSYGMRPDIPLVVEDYNSEIEDYDMMQKKFAEQNPNFLANWPYLKDLIPPDYDGSNINHNEAIVRPPPSIYNELPEMLPTPQPHKGQPSKVNELKDHWDGKNRSQQKKNSNSRPHYMTACHFKICNLGRKRNVRFISL